MRDSNRRPRLRLTFALCVAATALGILDASCNGTEDTIAVPRELPAGSETSTDVPVAVPGASMDAATPVDAAAALDAAVPVQCTGPTMAVEGVLALYTFDEDEGAQVVTDATGNHDGELPLGTVTTVDGPTGCNRALLFESDEQYFVIDDSSDWDLDVGSVDFWLWLPAEQGEHIGLLSRDLQNRDQPGHFSLFVDNEGRAMVRVQHEEDGTDNTTDAVSCSATALPREQWLHLGVNFGLPAVELYIDGILADGQGFSPLSDEWQCAQSGAFGIAGNDLPWVVGRTTFRSDGPLETLEYPATGCAIDHLRISGVRRDFAVLL